jgi:transposase
MKPTTFSLDLAKRVIQTHSVDLETGETTRETLKRGHVLGYFANREPCVVAMEACGSAHYWGRELIKLGHEVRLIAAKFVRPYVKSNKTDAADAEAIWEAAQRPGMRFVALKTEEQQAILGLPSVARAAGQDSVHAGQSVARSDGGIWHRSAKRLARDVEPSRPSVS